MIEEKELPKSPFPSWASFALLPPFRDKSLAKKAAKLAEIKEGSTILEIGCGPGFFTGELANAVGMEGKVISQDIQEKMLKKMKRRMKKYPSSSNVEPLLANSSKTGISSESIDNIFTVNVFEEIFKESQLEETAIELKRVLKNNGSLFFGEHKVSERMINAIFEAITAAGFERIEPSEKLFYHSAIFKKSPF